MRLTVFLVSVLAVALLSGGATGFSEAQVQPQLLEREGPKVKRQQGCFSARQGVVFYRSATHVWQLLRGATQLAGPSPKVRGKSCHWARYAASEWQARAYSAKRSYRKWNAERTLRDFEFADGNRAWERAVEEVQRVFPGTDSWLLSCSAAEGGHGRWVGYSGVSYSTWLRDSDTVGGPMQFRWSTFKGMYRHGLDHLLDRGYRVPKHLRDPSNDVTWRSALGQAVAAGWARYTGNDNSHWSASWSNGC